MLSTETLDRWSELAHANARYEDLEMPSPSLVAALLAGATTNRVLLASLNLVGSIAKQEFPIDGGGAKCGRLSRELLDSLPSLRGLPSGPRLIEAAWVGTDAAMYYVCPNMGLARRWPWPKIRIDPGRSLLRMSLATISEGDRRYRVSLGSRALGNVVALQTWAVSADPTAPSS